MSDHDRSHPQWVVPPVQPTDRPTAPQDTPGGPLPTRTGSGQVTSGQATSGQDTANGDGVVPVTPQPGAMATEGVAPAGRGRRWQPRRTASRNGSRLVAGAAALALLLGGGAGGFALAHADGANGGGAAVVAGDGDGRPDRGGR